MFTINIYVKLAIIAVCFIAGTVLTVLYGFGYTWILFLIGIIFLVSYLLLGTVQSASMLIQEQKFDEAETRINLTANPKWLYVTNRAFYYIIKGSLSMNRKDSVEAEAYFNDALALNLPSDNERAMVLLQLSNISASKGKWNSAKAQFRELKKLKVTEVSLKEQISQFEKAINNSGQMMAAGAGKRGGAMMSPGGKRRRPKMR